MALSRTAHIGPGTISFSGRLSDVSPTGRRKQATWQGGDHRFAHRPSSPHRSLWHATQRHHHAVDPRKNNLMSVQSWHEAGLRDPLVQGGEEGMCQLFCITKSIVLRCKTKRAFARLEVKKKSIPHQQESNSLPGSHQRFRNELNALPCGQFGHKVRQVLPLNRLKRATVRLISRKERASERKTEKAT